MCRDHTDVDRPHVVCKKLATMGTSGRSYDVLMLRMKRWLIAGIDSDDWEEGSKQSHHVGMGGRHMCEFADGLSEEQCDRIAGHL